MERADAYGMHDGDGWGEDEGCARSRSESQSYSVSRGHGWSGDRPSPADWHLKTALHDLIEEIQLFQRRRRNGVISRAELCSIYSLVRTELARVLGE